MRGLVVGVLLVVVVIGAFLGLGGYGGTPTAPSPALSAAPNPQIAQTLQVTLTAQQYSVYPTGATFVYTITQMAANGSQTSLAFNAKIPATLVSQTGFLHVYSATVSVTTTAVCTGINCVGYAYNITVKSQILVSTYTALDSSPVGVSIFSNTPTYQSAVPNVAPSVGGSYAIDAGIVTFAGLFALILSAFGGRNVPAVVASAVVFIGGFLSFLVIQWGFHP